MLYLTVITICAFAALDLLIAVVIVPLRVKNRFQSWFTSPKSASDRQSVFKMIFSGFFETAKPEIEKFRNQLRNEIRSESNIIVNNIMENHIPHLKEEFIKEVEERLNPEVIVAKFKEAMFNSERSALGNEAKTTKSEERSMTYAAIVAAKPEAAQFLNFMPKDIRNKLLDVGKKAIEAKMMQQQGLQQQGGI